MGTNLATNLSRYIAAHLKSYARNCTLISNGINKVFRCSGVAGNLIVRMVPEQHRSAVRLDHEILLIKALNEAGLPVCGVPNLDVELTFGPVVFESLCYNGFVTNAVDGRILNSDVADNIAFAKSLAKLHNATETVNSKNFLEVENLEKCSLSRKKFQDIATDVRKVRDDLGKDVGDARFGICHGDAWQGNAIYSNGEAVLFDFECHHFGPVAFDIATQLWWLRSGDSKTCVVCSNAFIEEYVEQSGFAVSIPELRYQILTRELQNLHQLDGLGLEPGLEDVIVERTRDKLFWVQQQTLLG